MQSFVSVTHAFVEYGQAGGILGRLAGKHAATHCLLRDINLQINAGSHITVFGKAGAGKTTLLRLLAGTTTPSQGAVIVNGQPPQKDVQAAAGYVGSEEHESIADTPLQFLQAFIKTHHIPNGPAQLAEIVHTLDMAGIMSRPSKTLSSTERFKVNLTRALLSQAPLLLLDDVADEVGVKEIKRALDIHTQGRTTLIATRNPATAEKLELPIILLHNGTLAHYGTCEDIAASVACPRLVEAWIENLRYDILQKIRQYPGTVEVRLVHAGEFAGQKLRILLQSSHYLPGLYDLLSQTDLVRVQEVPPSLVEILAKL